MTPDVPSESIDDLRRDIDALDSEILSLLARRATIAQRVGRLKAGTNVPAFSPTRERAVLDRVDHLNPGPFEGRHVRAIYREIISASRSLEEPQSVAYLGPPYTFSHQAAERHFGRAIEGIPLESFRRVFDHVDRGEQTYGVVPIENSTSGTVGETLDLFSEHDVHIYSEVILPVSHNLLALERQNVYTAIYSHAQALQQCRDWLATNLPSVPGVEMASTVEAAQRAAAEPGSAAIGPLIATEAYGLTAIATNIQDVANNRTRFYVIAKQPAVRSGDDKTALMLGVPDRVGALHDMLGVIRGNQINLSFIQSRPARAKPGEYLFFLELAGHPDDPNVKIALEELRATAAAVRVLGAWPANQLADLDG